MRRATLGHVAVRVAMVAVSLLGCDYPHANPIDPDYDGSSEGSVALEITAAEVYKHSAHGSGQDYSVAFTVKNVGSAVLPDVRLSFAADESDVTLYTYLTAIPIGGATLDPGESATNSDYGDRLHVTVPSASLPRTVDVEVTVHYAAGGGTSTTSTATDKTIVLRKAVTFN